MHSSLAYSHSSRALPPSPCSLVPRVTPQRLGLNVLLASGCKVLYVFLPSKSAVLTMTADDLARLNHPAALSFNLMSSCLRVADNDLFSYSCLVCLMQDCLVSSVTFLLPATGFLD